MVHSPGLFLHRLFGHSALRTDRADLMRWPWWLTDVFERMVSGRAKANELTPLLPWNRKAERLAAAGDA